MHYTLKRLMLLSWLAVLTAPSICHANVYISEFMADNDGVLQDVDGDEPDWIELFNNSDTDVDLTGWYLTDTETNLTQWAFPATTLPSNGFMIVFASGKDLVEGELHTNFKLNADGEQVLLVQPDGTTVVDQHIFPAMPEDVSFGYAFLGGGNNVVLYTGVSCKAHVPTSSTDSIGWTATGFNDSSWQSGTTGVGFDDDWWSTYDSLIGLTLPFVQDGWQTSYPASAYIRIPFTVTDAAEVRSLILKMKYDDGFVAYLNGTQVQIANFSGIPAWNSTANSLRDENLAVEFEEFDLSEYTSLLSEGNNVLAIHALNAQGGWNPTPDSDMLILPQIDVKYAGEIDASASGYLSSPTPGAENTDVLYEDFVEAPIAYPERGFYDQPVQVTLSNTTAGATIRYTTDGSEPTTSSTVYSGPITISSTTPLRSKAFIDGWKPSFSRTDTYLFLDDVLAQSRSQVTINNNPVITGMDAGVLNATYYDASNQLCTVRDALLDIPTISVVTDDDNLFGEQNGIYVNPAMDWEKPASVELINPDGSDGFQINSGLRIRGGWSRHDGYAKHAFRLFFREDYGAGKLRYPLFEGEGVDKFDKMDLRTAQNYNWTVPTGDPPEKNTFLRDVFARDSAREMGSAYTRSRYYHLYLNGVYWGIYMTDERPEARFAASYFGGDSADYDVVKSTSWRDPVPNSVEATDGTLDAYNRLYQAAMNGFANNTDYFAVLGLDSSGQPDPTKEKLVDLNELMDYLLLIYYTGATDNNISDFLGNRLNNLYAIYNRNNPDGFKWIQHDSEHSLDTSVTKRPDPSAIDRTGPFTDSHLSQPEYFNPQTLHEKLLANAEYRMAFVDRVYKHFTNNGVLTQAQNEARLDARKAQIDRAIIANAARWGNTDLDRDTWLNAVSEARGFFAGRADTVIGYLNADGILPSIDPPQISRADGFVSSGTQVSLSAAQGTIYYTTDGTDPRAIGGAVSGSAYSGPISISVPTKVKARAYHGGEWSALCEAVYWTEVVPLAVTELMYHAPGGNRQDFIEIRNITGNTVNLNGYKLDNAVDFKFRKGAYPSLEPGQFLLAIKDLDGFSSAYATNGIAIAGEYRGDFDNSGEKVDLEFWNHDLISFRYSDARNWPQAADGAGHSLVPLESAVDDEADGSLNYGGNWRASTYFGGSPGFADPVHSTGIVLNEITAHTDTGSPPPYDSNDEIELYNTTASPITLNGWYLSDTLDQPMKWAIPNGTVIPALGFVLFDEDDFHPDRFAGFGLDKAGELVVLSSPNGVVDAIRFKGQENGASLGRYPDGANWQVTVPTPDEPNQLAELEIWISALMYNPPAPVGYADGDVVEYIQLENRSASTVPLENATGPWRIDGGVDFDFPTGVTLPAGEKLWLVSFDPADTVLLNLFCTAYGLNAAEETILGPYQGQLSNEGERIALERPQDSDDLLKPLDISWVVVDELYYFDQAPWSNGAGGTGYPLVRSSLNGWGVPTESDTDADQLDDTWESDHFGSLLQNGTDDPDNDWFNNLEEAIAGTNPTNALSYLRIDDSAAAAIEWTAVTGRTYSVYWTDDLQQPFMLIASGLPYPQNSFEDHQHSENACNYYYIAVERE